MGQRRCAGFIPSFSFCFSICQFKVKCGSFRTLVTLPFLSIYYMRPGEGGSLNPLKKVTTGDAGNEEVHRPLGEHGKESSGLVSRRRWPLIRGEAQKKQRDKEQHGKLGEWQVIWNIWKEYAWGWGIEKAKEDQKGLDAKLRGLYFLLEVPRVLSKQESGDWTLHFGKITLALRNKRQQCDWLLGNITHLKREKR